jgi:hypothetical protein
VNSGENQAIPGFVPVDDLENVEKRRAKAIANLIVSDYLVVSLDPPSESIPLKYQ